MKNEVANNRPNLHWDMKSTDLNKDYISTTTPHLYLHVKFGDKNK